MSTILVIGATGTVGRQVVAELLATKHQVRALLRNPDAANLPTEVERVRGDLKVPETLDPALRNVDAVFLVWTAPPATVPSVINRIAKRVPRLVFLTAPHQTPHPFFQQPNPLRAMLSGIESHIESTHLEWAFIRPGMLASNCIDWWSPAFRNKEVPRWPLLQAPTAPIDPRDIAAVAAHILTDSTKSHAGKNYVITGPESLAQLEQLQIIADTIGCPLHYEDLTAEEARRVLVPPFPLPAINMLLKAWIAALGQPAYPLYNGLQEELAVAALQLPWLTPLVNERTPAVPEPPPPAPAAPHPTSEPRATAHTPVAMHPDSDLPLDEESDSCRLITT